MKTYAAVFDGRVFVPEEPVNLEPEVRVRITVEAEETIEDRKARRGEGLDQLLRRTVHSGGVDWAELDRGELYP
jgi:hypothetical protein